MSGKEVPIIDIITTPSPRLSAEGLSYINDFHVIEEESGRYRIRFGSIDLGYTLSNREHVITTINLISHALILHESCQKRYEHANSIIKTLADCTFSTDSTMWTNQLQISINDTPEAFGPFKTSAVTEAKFQEAFAYMKKVGHREFVGWLSDTDQIFSYGEKFVNLINAIIHEKKKHLPLQHIAQK